MERLSAPNTPQATPGSFQIQISASVEPWTRLVEMTPGTLSSKRISLRTSTDKSQATPGINQGRL